jgi:4-carboxymuconolactone decarboxylase
MGILIGMRAPHEFKNHVLGALGNGITAKEIEEVLIQAVPYAGFPAVSIAMGGATAALKEKGLIY